MTPEDIDWPPPVCEPCQWGFCDYCRVEPWCEHDCPDLYKETP